MQKDLLFVLNPDFSDEGTGPYFCLDCATMMGILAFYPRLTELLEVRFVDFPRPRPEVIALLGEENQSCPVLIVRNPPPHGPAKEKLREANGQWFVADALNIAAYLAEVHGTGMPH